MCYCLEELFWKYIRNAQLSKISTNIFIEGCPPLVKNSAESIDGKFWHVNFGKQKLA
jgi:hypothetical protein